MVILNQNFVADCIFELLPVTWKLYCDSFYHLFINKSIFTVFEINQRTIPEYYRIFLSPERDYHSWYKKIVFFCFFGLAQWRRFSFFFEKYKIFSDVFQLQTCNNCYLFFPPFRSTKKEAL